MKLRLIFLSICAMINAQSYQLPDATTTFVMNGQATSNIIKKGDTLFVATNRGIQFTDVNFNLWTDIDIDLKKASIIKMILDSKGAIWFTLGKDTTIAGDDLIKGSGIYRWNTVTFEHEYFSQPKDPRINFNEDLITVPVTTDINNISYDIIETIDTLTQQRYIWIASFAGSLRYLNPDSTQLGWRLNTPNKLKLDVAQNNATGYGQRTFALASDGVQFWVGTANGIYYSADQGNSFINTRSSISDLSGNFITELVLSEGKLFANCRIVNSGEFNALNMVNIDNPQSFEQWSWTKYLQEEWVRRIQTANQLWLAGSNSGFYISDDAGANWDKISEFYGRNIDSEVDASRINDILIDDIDQSKWFIASSDALIYTGDNGFNYEVYKSRNTLPEIKKNKNSLVYPSPFSPKHTSSKVNITFDMPLSGEVELVVYNFAMESLYTRTESKEKSIAANITWDGKDKHGKLLTNGVYFIKIKTASETYWNKLVILN